MQVRRKREEALSALDQAAYVYDLEVHHKQQKDEQAQAQAQAQRTQAQVQQQRAASIVEMVQGADGGVARRVAQQGGAAAEALAAQVYAPMVGVGCRLHWGA